MTALAQRPFPACSDPTRFNDYVGIPFLWEGYDRSGASCWGLVCLVYLEQFSIALPRHDELIAGVKERDGSPAAWQRTDGFEPVGLDDARAGDVLHMWGMFNGKRRPLHCGIVTEPGRVLHAEEATGAVISRYKGDNRFLSRVIGAYRCRMI